VYGDLGRGGGRPTRRVRVGVKVGCIFLGAGVSCEVGLGCCTLCGVTRVYGMWVGMLEGGGERGG